MLTLFAGDPALTELVITTGLTLGLMASAFLTIASLPWSDSEIAGVDRTAHGLVAATARRVHALAGSAAVRS